jgi:WD40 repeat protein
VTWRELRDVLDEELARLPGKYRAPLLLCYFQGLTQEEAAQQLGWCKRSVKYRLEHGRDRLRTRLARRGLVLSAALAGSMLASAGPVAGVPLALAGATRRAAVPFAARQSVAGVVSPRVIALARGGLTMMVLSRLPTAALGLLALILAITGAGLFAGQAARQAAADAAAPTGKAEPAHVDRQGDPLPPGAITRLGTVRFRTGGFGLEGLGFLPDGKTLVAAVAQSHAVQLWEAPTGKLLREISTKPLSIRGFALSPDGKYFAVGGFMPDVGNLPTQGAVGVWDVSSGKQMRTLERSDRGVDHCSMAFTPDGRLLASLGDSGILRIEEIATGLELLRHQFPRDILARLALSPDGKTLAVSSGPNTRRLYLWNWQAAEEPRALKVPDRVGRSLAFSPDGKRLAEAGDIGRLIRVWDVASGRLLYKLKSPEAEPYRPGSVAFSADGKAVIVATHSNTAGAIHSWEAATGRYRRRLYAGNTQVGRLAVGPDGRLLAGNGAGGVCVWDLASGKELAANDQAHQASVSRVAATGNLVVTAGDDRTIRIWNPTTGQQLRKLMHGYLVRAVALSPDGTKLASSSLDDTVCLWDVATGRKVYQLPGHGRLGGYRAVGFTPDGKHFLSWGDDIYLRKLDVTTGKAVLEHALRPTGVKVPTDDAGEMDREMFFGRGESAFSPDGKAFVLNTGNQFHVFDVATGKDLRQFPNEGSHVISLAISPDSKLVLASAWGKAVETKLPDGRVRGSFAKNHPVCLWELASGKLRKKVLLPEGGAGPVAFSADGKLFAAAADGPDPRIRLWDVARGRQVRSITGFRGPVRALAFSPDGKRLISGMDDTTALVWDLGDKR